MESESSWRGATHPPFPDMDLSILHGLPRQVSFMNRVWKTRDVIHFNVLILICTGVLVQEFLPELSFHRTWRKYGCCYIVTCLSRPEDRRTLVHHCELLHLYKHRRLSCIWQSATLVQHEAMEDGSMSPNLDYCIHHWYFHLLTQPKIVERLRFAQRYLVISHSTATIPAPGKIEYHPSLTRLNLKSSNKKCLQCIFDSDTKPSWNLMERCVGSKSEMVLQKTVHLFSIVFP